MASSRVSSIFRPNLFRDKVAIVTGGGSGIGQAISEELLFLGCKVMIASRNEDKLVKAAKSMKVKIPSSVVKTKECNIRKEDQVKELMSHTIKEFGKIDFLINNGGGQFPSPAGNISVKGWHAVIETNLTGTFLCCREVYNQWMEDHGGVIINIIADMWKGFPMMSHTGAARAGVDNLTKTLAIEWVHKGVRINSVAPGSFIYSESAAANYADKNLLQNQAPFTPTKRLGTPEEVSSTVCFLLSPAASLITGETVKVDGASSIYVPVNYQVPDHDKSKAYSWDTDNDTKSKL